MPDIEAIGDLATGGVVARAVEPAAGEVAGHTGGGQCLNCGCKLVGDYCHCCGQQAHAHRTVSAWWHDFLHSVLHLDGKFWRTMPMLALHPGELTRRYAEGERARFISPLALFLFSVFLMFAVFSLLGDPMGFGSNDRAEAGPDIAAEVAESERELAALQENLDEARAEGQPTAEIEGEMAGVRTELAARRRAHRLVLRLANEEEQRTAESSAAADEEPEITILTETGWAPLDRAVEKAEKNPSLLLYKLQANAYKFSWALIPISLPFVWMLFLHRARYRRDFGAYDHLVFITYSIAFMSLGGIVLGLLGAVGLGSAVIGSALTFIPPIHIYVQLRGAYRLSRWSALWRTAALLVFTSVALTLFLMLLVTVGVFS